MTATWWAQPFAPDGSAAAVGIQRQLGAPRLDPLSVLVREAAQNSWDARLGAETVDFRIALDRPGPTRREAWKRHLVPRSDHLVDVDLGEALDSPDLVLLTISDRGTTGLGGPLRADQASEESSDFVDLVRNIGEPQSKRFGGGTYGFGKGVLYTTSSIGMVVIRTRCMWEGRVQTRLIGAALGPRFDLDGRRYTGRHWWGRIAADDYPDPLTDAEATEAATALGFPERGPNELGTDIVIVGARLGTVYHEEGDTETSRGRTVRETGEYLASAMLWNLWPLLLADDAGSEQMTCGLSIDGEELSIPSPHTVLRLRPFVDAYRDAHAPGAVILERKRPRTPLGRFGLATYMSADRTQWTDSAAPFSGAAHHCALMRQAGLVVRYHPGPSYPEGALQYGAVFRTLEEVDEAFADAEPPTHDDWIVEKLSSTEHQSYIRNAFKRIDERLRDLVEKAETEPSSGDAQPPLGALSSRLSTLVPSVGGNGAEAPSGPGASGTGGRQSRPNVRIMEAPRLTMRHGEAVITAVLQADASVSDLPIQVRAQVVLESGEESDPPLGSDSPEVLELVSGEGHRVLGDSVRLKPQDPRRWTVFVRPVTGVVTRLHVTTLREQT